MKRLSKDAKTGQGYTEIYFPVFDIHHKTIGNSNEKNRIMTSAYESRCHPDDSRIMKTLLGRCSEDDSNVFSFIAYGLTQTTTNTTYICVNLYCTKKLSQS